MICSIKKAGKANCHSQWICFLCLVMGLIFLQSCQPQRGFSIREKTDSFFIATEHYGIDILKDGFRYSFVKPNGEVIAAAHVESGIQIGRNEQSLADIAESRLVKTGQDHLTFEAVSTTGIKTTISLWPKSHSVKLQIVPVNKDTYTIVGRTGGLTPAFGLADHAAWGETTDVTGFSSDHFGASTGEGDARLVSNFVVFPRQGFATVNVEPWRKIVRVTKRENVQGSKNVPELSALYYFIGNPKQLYKSFLEARNHEGYKVYKPKYEWFGVGWEAFGALAWNTNHQTVKQNIEEYLSRGFPLDWMVVGSGFWPRAQNEMDEHGTPYSKDDAGSLQATTSFGMWDNDLYPSPGEFIDYFHQRGLKFIIGLRTAFIKDGPYTKEGLEKGYFITENGQPKLFDILFPRPDCYILDGHNPDAVHWYVNLSEKWLKYGVDGFKEDIFGFDREPPVPDDNVDFVNAALMDKKVYIMGRNGYLGSPMDIHRFNDFNVNQGQDRGPINGLALAYSGFPNVYPDIVGGTGLSTGRFGENPDDSRLRKYLMRYAKYAAVNPSMSFGYAPWNIDEETTRIALEAARLHARLQPYIYDAAVDAWETGYPYPMTPLPLAYPQDPNVYELANTTRRSYEWMIGESLLATPLFGNDYATASTRDVYLPAGKWFDYDSGKEYKGPVTLEDFPLPPGKTPLFVGGKGIVIEKRNGELVCRVYPVREETETIFYYQDGRTRSKITVVNPDWQHIAVTDLEKGEKVSGKWKDFAYEFTMESGHDYRIK